MIKHVSESGKSSSKIGKFWVIFNPFSSPLGRKKGFQPISSPYKLVQIRTKFAKTSQNGTEYSKKNIQRIYMKRARKYAFSGSFWINILFLQPGSALAELRCTTCGLEAVFLLTVAKSLATPELSGFPVNGCPFGYLRVNRGFLCILLVIYHKPFSLK